MRFNGPIRAGRSIAHDVAVSTRQRSSDALGMCSMAGRLHFGARWASRRLSGGSQLADFAKAFSNGAVPIVRWNWRMPAK